MPPALEAARAEVAQACRLLAARRLVLGTAGNVSVRVGELVAVTATGARFEELTADQVSVVDLDGRVVGGTLAPTSELGLHLGVYRRYGAGAVVHTHAPMATAVGLVVDELPCVHYQMLLLGGTVRVAPYATFGTPELAEAVLAALDGRAAALMANHGALTHAGSLGGAVEQTELLEWACELYWRAASIGTPRALDAEAQQAVVAAATRRAYGSTHPATPEEPARHDVDD
ncbi:class II aldolase/adducin family protein [Frankia sp. CNm7]|uniref:Class II aldolase/adducin family protein n=1 Tax=Frankia nepalensis TaxID=1836974 RepID=A0A937RCM5_9ACTN|nr:class II aldolase/adducin family protein [Frankia nepalensis]MBL7509902.1 class II aldolase/adducin family protein [Frankia nepalensis]MBL7521074.1 class II aldolase/adducin family protein [Frankia nepalensis]MBL7629661.1 class II aldolase/adducin family protein [Frankia nepalensis]